MKIFLLSHKNYLTVNMFQRRYNEKQVQCIVCINELSLMVLLIKNLSFKSNYAKALNVHGVLNSSSKVSLKM